MIIAVAPKWTSNQERLNGGDWSISYKVDGWV